MNACAEFLDVRLTPVVGGTLCTIVVPTLTAYNMSNGISSQNNSERSARFNRPNGIATSGTGDIYVADTGNSTIREITPAGVVTTVAGLAGTQGHAMALPAMPVCAPYGIATDSTINIYAADTCAHTIRKVSSSGVVTTFAGSPGLTGAVDGTGRGARFSGPAGIATDSAGNIYVADFDNQM